MKFLDPNCVDTITSILLMFFFKTVFHHCVYGLRPSIIIGPSCQYMYMRHPRRGQPCITDTKIYTDNASEPQERCMRHCLQDPSCMVINYNIAEDSCRLGHAPCVSLEPESDFLTILIHDLNFMLVQAFPASC